MLTSHWLSKLANSARGLRRPAPRSRTRSQIVPESLESRVVLTTNMITPIAVDGTVDASEESSVTVLGTTTASTVRLTASDADGTTADVVVDATVIGGGFIANLDLSSLADGSVTITADENVGIAGEVLGADSELVTLATSTPTVNIGADANADGAINLSEITTAGGDLVVSGVAAANADVEVSVLTTGGAIINSQTVTADANGQYSATFDLDTDGTAGIDAGIEGLLTITATDTSAAAGLTQIVNLDVSVDDPTLSVPSFVDSILTELEAASLDLSGTAEADSSVEVTITDAGGNVVAQQTVTADANGNFSVEDLDVSAAVDGTLTVEVVATDALGNVSSAVNATATFVSDTVVAGGGNLEVKVNKRGVVRFKADRDASIAVQVIQTSNGIQLVGLNGTTINGVAQFDISNATKLRGRLGNGNDLVAFSGTGASSAALNVNLNGKAGLNQYSVVDFLFSGDLKLRNFTEIETIL